MVFHCVLGYDNIKEHVTLATIDGTVIIVPCFKVEALKLIWREGTGKFHPPPLDLQISRRDLETPGWAPRYLSKHTTSQMHVIFTSKRHFDVIITCLFRCVLAGIAAPTKQHHPLAEVICTILPSKKWGSKVLLPMSVNNLCRCDRRSRTLLHPWDDLVSASMQDYFLHQSQYIFPCISWSENAWLDEDDTWNCKAFKLVRSHAAGCFVSVESSLTMASRVSFATRFITYNISNIICAHLCYMLICCVFTIFIYFTLSNFAS